MPKDFFANRDLLLQKKLTLTLCNDEHLERVANALNAPTRRKILSLLTANSYTIQEIADRLNMSLSNTSFHVKFLQKAGLVNLTQNHSKRGNEKIVALEKHCLEILFINEAENSFPSSSHAFSTELPVGSFTLFDIVPPCGIADADGNLIGAEALPDIFYNYKRIKGEIIWFTEGYLEYHVSNAAIKNKVLEALQISCEVCSECANYNNSFKSDITFWMNDKEIGTYTSPGDFGGRSGKYTPKSWPAASTQYGMLVQIRIDEMCVLINQVNVSSEISIDDFAFITKEKCLRFKLGVKKNAKYAGGLNLFGRNFGDFQQGIRISATYLEP
ncbi:MAG: ArsR family transcriptional regulator [Clostridia bacterium]|nr:ArsR family transcriptional regulator [Clostridia bacterium]